MSTSAPASINTLNTPACPFQAACMRAVLLLRCSRASTSAPARTSTRTVCAKPQAAAANNAVVPPSAAFTSAPAPSSASTIFQLPLLAPSTSADVSPRFDGRTEFGSAPPSSSTLTISTFPSFAAIHTTDAPSSLHTFASAPCASNTLTASTWPFCTASKSTIEPSTLAPASSSPRSASTSPRRTALSTAAFPSVLFASPTLDVMLPAPAHQLRMSIDHASLYFPDVSTIGNLEAPLAALGIKSIVKFGEVVGWGTFAPQLWTSTANPKLHENGVPKLHVILHAPSSQAVKEFHAAALEAGFADAGQPEEANGFVTATVDLGNDCFLGASANDNGSQSSGPTGVIACYQMQVTNLDSARTQYAAHLAVCGASVRDTSSESALEFGLGSGPATLRLVLADSDSVSATHVGFHVASTDDVDAWYAAALEAGCKDNGPPGPRPMYGPTFYGAFAFDNDHHNIEACIHTYVAPASSNKRSSSSDDDDSSSSDEKRQKVGDEE